MPKHDTGGWDDINAEDVAVYIRDVAEQLANMARLMGLQQVADPLEQAHRAAAALLQENAAPEDAA
ncbi:hypothetical protein [Terricaulis sp.]|uniref:hypothetical protein n=1 Tax=Terricaulis sp. TaxID=2768686 RepID=UPI002AC64871|nr:hypothetical protein [Terricaulis sp.]MDZ4693113.1 hypothetical protein [Terricaulis sp.]